MARLEFKWVPKFSSRRRRRRSGSLLILQSRDTGTGGSSKLLEIADEAWDPWCFAFSKPVGEAGRMGRQSTIRNYGLFLIRDGMCQGFFFNGKVLILFLKDNIMTSWLCTEALEISWVHSPSSAIY